MRERGTLEELHNEKRLEGWRENIQLPDSTSEVNRGQTLKNLIGHVKDFALEKEELLKE